MRAASETEQISRLLGSVGLGQIGDPGVIAQMGYLVEDHEHFRQMILKCEPSERYTMYEALAPNLRFTAKPLDEYMIESRRLAEVKQLPVQQPDGTLKPYTPPEVRTIQSCVDEVLAKHHLMVTCRKCTKEATFPGKTRAEAVWRARDAGWTYDEVKGDGREICPDCPATRAISA